MSTTILTAAGFKKSKEVKGAYDRDVDLKGKKLTIRVDGDKLPKNMPDFVLNLLNDSYWTGYHDRDKSVDYERQRADTANREKRELQDRVDIAKKALGGGCSDCDN